MELVKEVQWGSEEYLIFCSHPPVVTLGRGTKSDDLTTWEGETFDAQRGGRATYHGPGQVVIYPILNLSKRKKDLHGYLRVLEKTIVMVLKGYGIFAGGGADDTTGVWIGKKKIASIGIGVKKWVTFHGLAFNLEIDKNAFQGINPCGFDASTMICLEEALSRKILRSEFQDHFENYFCGELQNLNN